VSTGKIYYESRMFAIRGKTGKNLKKILTEKFCLGEYIYIHPHTHIYIYMNIFLPWYWRLNSGFHACFADTLPFESHSQPFLLLVILGIESHVFAWAHLDHDSSICDSYIAGVKGTCHHTQLFVEMGTF
jgi:hypothetical protein